MQTLRITLGLLQLVLAGSLLSSCQTAPDPGAGHAGLARREFQELWTEGRMEVLGELFAPRFDWTVNGERHSGIDDYQAFVIDYRRGFPDLAFELVQLITQGDQVVVQWIARGTNHGELMAMPATGIRIEIGGITILRIKDGRIAEDLTYWDEYGMLEQLGLLGG